ncbi:MAG: hypothetical protein AAB680_03145, partial [Pseudomonadota bacterium]
GFDAYDPYRGWLRGNRWYANPSQWSEWGGWFSFFVYREDSDYSSANQWGQSPYLRYPNNQLGFSYSNYSFDPYFQRYFGQYGDNCMRLVSQDQFRGDRVSISFVACQTMKGTWREVPNTRQMEYGRY